MPVASSDEVERGGSQRAGRSLKASRHNTLVQYRTALFTHEKISGTRVAKEIEQVNIGNALTGNVI
jgi:hypothetical protein